MYGGGWGRSPASRGEVEEQLSETNYGWTPAPPAAPLLLLWATNSGYNPPTAPHQPHSPAPTPAADTTFHHLLLPHSQPPCWPPPQTFSHTPPPGLLHFPHCCLQTPAAVTTLHHPPPPNPDLNINIQPGEERAGEAQSEKSCWTGPHQPSRAEGLCRPALSGTSLTWASTFRECQCSGKHPASFQCPKNDILWYWMTTGRLHWPLTSWRLWRGWFLHTSDPECAHHRTPYRLHISPMLGLMTKSFTCCRKPTPPWIDPTLLSTSCSSTCPAPLTPSSPSC